MLACDSVVQSNIEIWQQITKVLVTGQLSVWLAKCWLPHWATCESPPNSSWVLIRKILVIPYTHECSSLAAHPENCKICRIKWTCWRFKRGNTNRVYTWWIFKQLASILSNVSANHKTCSFKTALNIFNKLLQLKNNKHKSIGHRMHERD